MLPAVARLNPVDSLPSLPTCYWKRGYVEGGYQHTVSTAFEHTC